MGTNYIQTTDKIEVETPQTELKYNTNTRSCYYPNVPWDPYPWIDPWPWDPMHPFDKWWEDHLREFNRLKKLIWYDTNSVTSLPPRIDKVYDVKEEGNKRIYTFPLPGYSKDDINVVVNNEKNTLEVTGERKADDPTWKESFKCSVKLRKNENVVRAYMENGVLYVVTETDESANVTTIPVEDNNKQTKTKNKK